MQTQTNDRPDASARKSLPGRLFSRVRRNALMKLFATLLAIFFWLVVLASDPTLLREKVFNTTVAVVGSDALRSKGYIVMDELTDELLEVEMTVEVTQSNYDRTTVSSFAPRLDLSQISGEGVQEVFFTTAYNTYGDVKQFEPASVTVNVERYSTRSRVPVTVRAVGETVEPLWHSIPTSDPATVTVSGPASLVNRVRRAVAELPLESLSRSQELTSLASPLRLETADGTVIESPLILITAESVAVDSVRVDCSVLPMKTVPVDVESAVSGVPVHGYVIESVSVSPAMVTVADSAEALDYLNAVFLDKAVSAAGATQSFVATVPLRSAAGYAFCSAKEATVSVKVVPATHTHTYTHLPVLVENLAPGLTARLSRTMLSAVISGHYHEVEGLKAERVHLYVNAEGLEAGVYNVPVLCRVDGTENFTYTPQHHAVTLTISAE